MNAKKLLLCSSSRAGKTPYLESAKLLIHQLLGEKRLSVAFIPFAVADNDFESYGQIVQEALHELPLQIVTVQYENAQTILQSADVIMVGGGNTFKLMHDLYHFNLVNLIRKKVEAGVPYIGWSAGANIAGRTIGTTNDMPIIEPQKFEALGFLPFQINPHYYNQKLEGFNGETRDQRLSEFLELNRHARIVALPEGSALKLENGELKFLGIDSGYVFLRDTGSGKMDKQIISESSDLQFLL